MNNQNSSANPTSLNRLILKQREAIRIICNTGFREHTAPLFKQLKILPLNELIHLSKLKFMHSFYHNILPESFNRMWLSNRERYPERILRNADQLYIPAHNYATLKRLPKFSLPYIWNSADNEKSNPVQYQFLRAVKTLLLQNLH
jgi:hypothetical protein